MIIMIPRSYLYNIFKNVTFVLYNFQSADIYRTDMYTLSISNPKYKVMKHRYIHPYD
jgi:hypothetical protein